MRFRVETIHVVLDRRLLDRVDGAARLSKQSRSAVISEALRMHLVGGMVVEPMNTDEHGCSGEG